MKLPPYKGSVLRGGFGSAFRRVACAPRAKNCLGCLLRGVCPYAYVFETSPPEGSAVLRNLKDVPRPFVIEPPEDYRTEYTPGEALEFGLVLIGRGVEYLPFFIAAFKELGRTGIGPLRAGFDLVRVEQLKGTYRHVVYDADSSPGTLNLQPVKEGCVYRRDVAEEAARLPLESVRIEFLTQTRLKADDEMQSRPDFDVLVRSILRRVSSLAYFHHGVALDLDYRELIERARQVRTVIDRTRWVNWVRYSNRQDASMNLGGVVGWADYAGDLSPFRELLIVGQLVHVGKNATFGLGRIRVKQTVQSHRLPVIQEAAR